MAVIIPHWSVAPKMIAGTDLILTVARAILQSSLEDKRLAVLPPPMPLPAIPFSQISHKSRRSDPALRWLREMIVASTGQTSRRKPSSFGMVAPGHSCRTISLVGLKNLLDLRPQ